MGPLKPAPWADGTLLAWEGEEEEVLVLLVLSANHSLLVLQTVLLVLLLERFGSWVAWQI